MRYPITTQPGDRNYASAAKGTALPVSCTAGDSLDEAIANAPEAITLWLEDHVERIGAPPMPSPIDELRKDRRFRGWIWAVVDVDLSKLADRTERINITMSKRLLRRVDAHARKMGETRSGLLARGAMELMAVAQTTDRAPKRPARRRR